MNLSLGKWGGHCLPNAPGSSVSRGQGPHAMVADVHGKMLPALPHLLLHSGVCTHTQMLEGYAGMQVYTINEGALGLRIVGEGHRWV